MPAAPFTSSSCGFKIRVTFPASQVFQKVLKAAGGTTVFLTTGSQKIAYTNVQTGKTFTANVSGQGHNTFFADGSVTLVARGALGSL